MAYYEIGFYGEFEFIPVKRIHSEQKAVLMRDILQELAENDAIKLPDWVNEGYPDLNIDSSDLASVRRCKSRLVIEKRFEKDTVRPPKREKPRKIPKTQMFLEM